MLKHESVANASTADIKFGYCTEIMVELGKGPTSRESYDHDNFQAYLAELGIHFLLLMMRKSLKSMFIQKILV
ncbi:hypothetical protein GCM10017706_32170 [Lactococcus lactis subsp. hordniae]